MLVIEPITHIRRDAPGIAWIADTNTKVKEVVLDQIAHGWDAREIHRQHPPLSLAHIHSALAYYYDHSPEIDAPIREDLEDYEDLRVRATNQISRADLPRRLVQPGISS